MKLGRILKVLFAAFGVVSIAVWLVGATIEKLSLPKKSESRYTEQIPEELLTKVSFPVVPEASSATLVADQQLMNQLREKASHEAGARAGFDSALAEAVEKSAATLVFKRKTEHVPEELSVANMKWLFYEKWGYFLIPICHYLDLPTDTIVSLCTHESGANPSAVNPSSSATGAGQFLFSTAKKMAKKYDIPLELLDRKDALQSILLTCLFFREHMDYFHNKPSPATWAVATHLCGLGAVEDSVSHYDGDVNRFWFTRVVMSVARIKPVEAPEWAQDIWKNEQWSLLEAIQKKQALASRKRRRNKKAVAAVESPKPMAVANGYE